MNKNTHLNLHFAYEFVAWWILKIMVVVGWRNVAAAPATQKNSKYPNYVSVRAALRPFAAARYTRRGEWSNMQWWG